MKFTFLQVNVLMTHPIFLFALEIEANPGATVYFLLGFPSLLTLPMSTQNYVLFALNSSSDEDRPLEENVELIFFSNSSISIDNKNLEKEETMQSEEKDTPVLEEPEEGVKIEEKRKTEKKRKYGRKLTGERKRNIQRRRTYRLKYKL